MNHLRFRLSSAQLNDNTFVVTLRGEIDTFQALEVDRELEALQVNGAQFVVVDLLDVPSVEPTVVSVLLMHARRLRINGGELTLVSEKHDVKRAIGTHMFPALQVVATLSAALHQSTAISPS
jgi:anti-anti-sigma factor